MAKAPKTPQEVFPEIVEDLQGIYGEALQSVILYGSSSSSWPRTTQETSKRSCR